MNPIRTLSKGWSRALSRGTLHLLFSMGFSQAAMLMLGLALARFLAPGDFGHVRVIGAVLKLAVIPAALGIPAAISKYTAECQDRGEGKKLFSQGLAFSLAVSAFVSGLLFAILSAGNPVGDEVARRWLLGLGWTVPLSVFSAGSLAYLQGEKRIREMALCQGILAACRLFVVGGLTFAFFLPGYAAGVWGAELIGVLVLWRLTRPDLSFSWGKAALLKLLRLGIFTSLGLTFATLTLTMDTLCLSAILGDPAQVGQYGVAATLAMGLLLVPEAISQSFFPHLSECCRNLRLLRTYFFHLLELVGIVMLLVGAAAWALAPVLVGAVFGSKYPQAAGVLRILIPGIFFYSLQKISGITLFARGRTDLNFYVTLIGGILDIVLNIILIRKYGLPGAAWATSATFALRTGLSFWFLSRELLKHSLVSGIPDGEGGAGDERA